MKKLYLAYGSNLNLSQMAVRCPTAVVKGPTVLRGYRLLFRGSHGAAVATVERCRGAEVPALVWEIGPADEAALDRYEAYPRLYTKLKVRVQLDGKLKTVMLYVMNPGPSLGRPSPYYLETIRQGYIDAGFDKSPLADAVLASI